MPLLPDPGDAVEKLRLVLDYVPCERCLATPTRDQEILCSVCARLHRQVGVRVATRTTVILERPTPVAPPPEAPVVLAPPPPPEAEPEPAPAAVAAPPPVEARLHDPKRRKPWGETAAIEVVLEPFEEAPPPAPVAAPAEAPAAAAAAAEAPAEPEPEWDDVASFAPPDDVFEYAKPAEAPREAPPPDPVVPVPREAEDSFFAPPPREEPVPAEQPPPEPVWPVEEEVPLEPAAEEPNPWAPREEERAPEAPPPDTFTDFLAEEAAQEERPPEPEPSLWAPPPEEEVLDLAPVEEAPPPAPEVVEAEIVEMEIVEDEPAPPESDLFRLRGFGREHQAALAAQGVETVAHLSGHDPHELAQRAGVPADLLLPWVQVADLVHEAGVPLDAANALVAAGVPGPRGLREMDAQAIVDRVGAFGGAALNARDVNRWKRRV